jgi:hypothetical protein
LKATHMFESHLVFGDFEILKHNNFSKSSLKVSPLLRMMTRKFKKTKLATIEKTRRRSQIELTND